MLPDFNRLHIFYLVFRASGVARASRDLFVTQSAVSQNLKKLEQELGINLFHRLPKKLVPTPAAQRLFLSIEPFFSTLEVNLKTIFSSEGKPQGLLRIGAPPVFGAEFLPGVIAAFRKKYPLVTFQLTLGVQSVVARACRAGELDIALVDIFGNREELSWNLLQEPLVDEPLILVGAGSYVRNHLAHGHTAESVSQCQFIAYQPMAPELMEWFSHHFKRPLKQPSIIVTVENVYAVVSAVRSHLGLAIVPRYLVETALKKKEIVAISAQKTDVKSRISLLKIPHKKLGISETLFIEVLREKISKIRK
jgi:DNA-binding transcriptional LysR family regulator